GRNGPAGASSTNTIMSVLVRPHASATTSLGVHPDPLLSHTRLPRLVHTGSEEEGQPLHVGLHHEPSLCARPTTARPNPRVAAGCRTAGRLGPNRCLVGRSYPSIWLTAAVRIGHPLVRVTAQGSGLAYAARRDTGL